MPSDGLESPGACHDVRPRDACDDRVQRARHARVAHDACNAGIEHLVLAISLSGESFGAGRNHFPANGRIVRGPGSLNPYGTRKWSRAAIVAPPMGADHRARHTALPPVE